MAGLVDNRYALSLFDVGVELDMLQEFYKELSLLDDIFQREKDLLKILNHPRIKNNEKKDLINRVFRDKLSREILNFIHLLIDRRRIGYIIGIINEYIEIYNKYQNIVRVVAITAIPMDQNLISKMINTLSKRLNKKVELSNKINKAIIGGVLLKIENKQIDGTLKGQLESMAKVLGI